RICAWIVTSSAVVGSSAIRSFGLQASALPRTPRPPPAPPPRARVPRTRSSSSAARAPASFLLMSKCVSSGSLIWRPIVSTGFRLVIGSWKIIAICLPLSPRISRSFSLSRSRPSKRAVPERTRPARGSSPSSASAVTLLPQPDSPTIPSVSPGEISNEIPLTAWTSPLPVQNWTRRASTERSGSLDATDGLPPARPQVRESAPFAELPRAAAELRIERLAQAVADQGEPEYREHDRDARHDREPRRRL